MEIKNKKVDELIKKFQAGGEMEAPADPAMQEAAPAPQEGGGDPMEQIIQGAAQAVQTQDPNLALQVCQALVQIAGGEQPAPEAPGQPVYGKGGVLKYWKKN